MAKLDYATWRRLLDYLRSEHASVCRQWFEQLEPNDLGGGVLRIGAAGAIQQKYLTRQCREHFTEAAQAVTGQLVAVEFFDRNARPPARPEPGPPQSRPAAELETDAARNGDAGAAPEPELAAEPEPASPADAPDDDATPVEVGGNGRAAPQAPGISSGSVFEGRRRPADDADDDLFEQTVISPDYSLDTFITGPNNNLAYAASVAVAKRPGTAYNPLFIHGGVGLGKTHLLQGICQRVLESRPDKRICYLSCDAFMNQFLDVVSGGDLPAFRHRYRHVDVLVIDDIHFLADRDRTQEEFFHTFNALYQNNKQIVLSSDSPPSEIPQIEERLVSRFSWGLVTHISKPTYETRVAIVRAKAKLRGMTLPDEVVNFIAAKIESNARELEGALTTIIGHANLQDRPVELALAHQALGGPPPSAQPGHVRLQHIIQTVTEFYNVKLPDLQSKRRQKSITEPRQVCMYLLRRRTRYSLEEIGGYFGGRDHTTVMHAVEVVTRRKEEDPDFARQLQQLDDTLG